MTIQSGFNVDGYKNGYQNTTCLLKFYEEKRNFVLEVYDDETEELITEIWLDEILNAFCDIIR